MNRTLANLVQAALHGQVTRFVAMAKEQAAETVRRKAAEAGATAALALGAFIFAMFTLVIGLIALCLWLSEMFPPVQALAIVGGGTLVVALLFGVAVAMRGESPAKPAKPSATSSQGPLGIGATGGTITDQAAVTASRALDTAAATVRSGPREAVLAVVATTLVLGIILGRR